MLYVSVFVVTVLGSVAAGGPSDSPECSDAIDTNLKKTFPDPVPKDLLEEISKLGSWSVLTVTAPNIKQLRAQDAVCTHNVVNKDKKTVEAIRKIHGALPQQFTVEEKGDKFNIVSTNDPQNSFTVHALYFKDGVAVVSKCCKDCKGDGLNIAVAVADKKKEDSAAIKAVMEVRQKLKSIKLDIPVGDLSSCVEQEI